LIQTTKGYCRKIVRGQIHVIEEMYIRIIIRADIVWRFLYPNASVKITNHIILKALHGCSEINLNPVAGVDSVLNMWVDCGKENGSRSAMEQ
jgi:hypothetical protein